MKLDWTHYYLYQEIKDVLDGLAAEHPSLAKVFSIGKSGEGREIWGIEITNQATGCGSTKPGLYIDGNTHAGEVTGSSCCLYTAWYLLDRYPSDERVKGLVDSRVWYIVPRLTVDGSEVYLTTAEMVRSAPRMYPEPEEKDGLYAADANGDGKILMMRVVDPQGEFKICDRDPRLMVKRAANETGGTYYRIYREGLIRNHDGGEIKQAPSKWGLDFNRNYPANWALQYRQAGSGRYPFSEPEIRAVAQFYLSHPNIVSGMAFHTSGGCLLRPFATMGDDKYPKADLALYKAIGELGTKATGYPTWSIWEAFTDKTSDFPVGSDIEWLYEWLGIFSWETELWDMQTRAGLPKRTWPQIDALSEAEKVEIELKLLAWNDSELGGKGFHNWIAFDHPQLGKVEIGGWEPKFARQNPPPHLLPDEVERNNEFSLVRGETTPLLRIKETGVESLGAGVWRVTAWAQNQGYMSTNVTEMALRVKQAKPVVAEISGATVVMGKAREEIGHLQGRAAGGYMPARNEKRVQWVVTAPAGTKVTVRVSCPRAGQDSREIELK